MNTSPNQDPFPAARFIKEIGRGKDGARSMSRADARELYAAMLDGRVSDLELGAILLGMRAFLPQLPIQHNPDAAATGRSIGMLFVAWVVLSHVLKQRWAGMVVADERDARIALVAGQWARCATIVCVVGIAVLLGFSDTDRLRGFSYPYIAQLLMQALLWGLWFEQVATAVLYWRDRRAMA